MVRRTWAVEQKENSSQLIEAKTKASRYRARRIRVSASRVSASLPFNVITGHYFVITEVSESYTGCKAY